MPLTTVQVTCQAFDQNGNPVQGAIFTLALSGADVSGGYVLPETVTGIADASGTVVLPVWPNALGATESFYNVKVENPDTGKVVRFTATIPNANCLLHNVANLPAYPGKSDGQLIIDAAVAAVAPAQAAQLAAAGSATAAAGSATNASGSATAAAGSATAAGTSATNAGNSATAAAGSATAANTSATNAATSATAADGSKTAAATSATNAATSATAADGSKTAAQTAKTAAETAQGAAATSATNAATSATNAATSASGAAGSATAAAGSATSASTQASNAATSAGNAANSATAAATSAGAAAGSATSAATSAATATTKASDAATSATSAANSTATATTKAAQAATSETNAALSATSATASATAAAASAALSDLRAAQAIGAVINVASANAAATNAQTALAGTTSAATQAANARDQAIAASQTALAGNEQLAAISKTFHTGSVVKTFLYDTSKDSDSGQWRKKTQAASWFTEAINGAWLGEATNELAARGDNLLGGEAERLDFLGITGGTGSVTLDAAVAPDNTTTADKLVSTNNHFRQANITVPNDSLMRASSVYVRGTALIDILVGYSNGTGVSSDVIFNPATGAVVSGTAKVEAAANGYWRVTVYAQNNGTGNTTYYTRLSGGVSTSHDIWGLKVNIVGALSSTYSASPENIANGGFDNGLTNWTSTVGSAATATVTNGVLSLFHDGTFSPFVSQAIATVAGHVYRVSYDGVTGGASLVRRVGTTLNGNDIINTSSALASDSFCFVATGATTYITFGRTAAGTVTVDNISVKEVTVLATPYVPFSQLTNAYYHNTTDGKFYSLGATYGTQVETFRGNKREFPAAALIVAEAAKIVIYDATDPLLSMWMVIGRGGTAFWTAATAATSLCAINGQVMFGSDGLFILNFPADNGFRHHSAVTSNTGTYRLPLSSRNTAVSYAANNVPIVNASINDVTATVLPDAPNDPATGLPIPTVAVATPGGLSIIKHDGTVVSGLTAIGHLVVVFRGASLYSWRNASNLSIYALRDVRTLSAGFTYDYFFTANPGTGLPWILDNNAGLATRGQVIKQGGIASSTNNGLTLITENPAALAGNQAVKSMVAYITAAYNSGWQVGDSRAAFLCDIVPEVITASGELVTNGSFVADTTGWTAGFSTIAVNSGKLRVTADGTGSPSSGRAYQIINTTIGKTYTVTADLTGGTGFAALGIDDNASDGVAIGTNNVSTGGTLAASLTFVAKASTAAVIAYTSSTAGQYADFDNISCKETAGVELVTNGTFTTDAASWSVQSGTVASVGGRLRVTQVGTAAAVFAEQDIATVIGKQYTFSVDMFSGNGVVQPYVNIGTSNPYVLTLTYTSNGTYTGTFTAQATTTRILLRTTATVDGNYVEFDNVTCRDAQNLILNGTFDVDTSNWTAKNGATLSVVAGAMRVTTPGGVFAMSSQNITTVAGRTYTVTADVITSGVSALLGVGTAGTVDVAMGFQGRSINGQSSVTFVATAASHAVQAYVHTSATVGQFADFDNISVKDVTELVQNGQFEGMTTGWSQGSAFPSLASCANGELIVTPNVAFGAQLFSFATVVGKTYKVQGSVRRTSGTASTVYLSQTGSTGLDVTIGPNTTSATAVPLSFDFTATATTSYIAARVTSTTDTGGFDNISVKLAEPDRSVKANGLIVNGSLTKAAVASGAQAVAWSGFSAANYLEQPYNANLDFGTGDFYAMGWIKTTDASARIMSRARTTDTLNRIVIDINTNLLRFFTVDTGSAVIVTGPTITDNAWHFVSAVRRAGVLELSIDTGTPITAAASHNVTNTTATLRFGEDQSSTNPLDVGSLAMWRIGATAPSADQIAKIYRDELQLFQPNAQCTIDGTSSAVTALAYGEESDVLQVGTSWGRSAFQGLLRVESVATSIGALTSLSAGQGAHITGGATAARYVQPSMVLRDEIRKKYEARVAMGYRTQPFDFDATAAQTTFTLPKGWTAKEVIVAGQSQREGATKNFTRSFDGFQESIVLATGQSAGTWVQILAVRSN
jgi:hypothetical protein